MHRMRASAVDTVCFGKTERGIENDIKSEVGSAHIETKNSWRFKYRGSIYAFEVGGGCMVDA